jgi:plastocyanin
MTKTWSAALAALAVLLAACGSSTSAGPSPNRLTVFVDAKQPNGQPINVAATAYFPNALTAHAGDSVDFKTRFLEPHTVTFGSLVDNDLKLAAAAGPPSAAGPPPSPSPEFAAAQAKLPDLIPLPPKKPGPPVADQAAGQPCFLSTGAPPSDGTACSKDQQKQTDFDGTATYYNSGFLPTDAVFTLKLSDSLKPGTYGFMCLLHREGMTGKLTVVDKGSKSDSPSDVTSRGQSQLQTIISALTPLATQARQAPEAHALAGFADPTGKIRNAFVAEFGPKSASIPVGGTISWTVFGPHTITFGATAADVGGITKNPDGSVALSLKALAPAGGPGAPQGPPRTAPTTVDAGVYSGQGFHSSGLLPSFPPAFISYKLKFTTAGTYHYFCLIHTDMEGTVKVG